MSKSRWICTKPSPPPPGASPPCAPPRPPSNPSATPDNCGSGSATTPAISPSKSKPKSAGEPSLLSSRHEGSGPAGLACFAGRAGGSRRGLERNVPVLPLWHCGPFALEHLQPLDQPPAGVPGRNHGIQVAALGGGKGRGETLAECCRQLLPFRIRVGRRFDLPPVDHVH